MDKWVRIQDRVADDFLCKITNLEWPPKEEKKNKWFSRLLPAVGVSLAGGLDSPFGRPYLSQITSNRDALRRDWLGAWREKLREAWREKLPRVRRDRLRSLVETYVALQGIHHQAVRKVEPTERANLCPIAQAVAAAGGNILEFGSRPDLLNQPQAAAATPHDPFLQILHRALEIVKIMRLCRNPQCRHPFFLGRKKTDKYCSQECAKPAKRAAKLRWWRKYGDARRRAKAQPTHRKGKRP